MKIKNIKIRKKLLIALTTGGITLTGAYSPIFASPASDNLLDAILTATDGYDTPHHYDTKNIPNINNEIVESNKTEVTEETESELIKETEIEEELEVAREGYVQVDLDYTEEEPVEEDKHIETERETVKTQTEASQEENVVEETTEQSNSNLLSLMGEEANQAVKDYFLGTDEELVNYINAGDFEGLSANAKDIVKTGLDFLFFDGSISNYKKNQVNNDAIIFVVDELNNYISVVSELSPGFVSEIGPKYDQVTDYLSQEFIEKFDEIGAEYNTVEEEQTMSLN